MGRYIDADALKEVLEKEYGKESPIVTAWLPYFLEKPPTADVVPVRHGYWLRPFPTTPKSYVRICSVCKGKAYAIGKEYDYCPNCQAVMDEEVER